MEENTRSTIPPEEEPDLVSQLGVDVAGALAGALAALEQWGRKPAWEPPPVEEVQEGLPDYEIVRLAGRGGMGAVYEARHRRLERRVAIKVLPPELEGVERLARRFEREGRLLARLQHPQVVTVYDCGESAAGWPFLVMEYVAGETLRERLKRGALEPGEARRVISEIAEAVAAAHAAGILHRDLKPSNILLTEAGAVKVADFGLSSLWSGEGAGERAGTRFYGAPEQLSGDATTGPRADVYSLGVVACELLSGRGPGSPGDALAVPGAEVGEPFGAVVRRALSPEPARRQADAEVFLEEWRAAVQAAEQTAAQRRRLRRARRLTLLFAALAVAAAAGGWLAWRQTGRVTAAQEVIARQEREARHAAALADREAAETLVASGAHRWPEAMARLAHGLRAEPENKALADRIVALATQKHWPQRAGAVMRHAGPVLCAEITPDAAFTVTGSEDGTARLWQSPGGTPAGPPMLAGGPVRHIVISQDATLVVTVVDNAAQIWKARTGEKVGVPMRHEKEIKDVALSPDGRWVATASEDHSARIWNAATGEPVTPPLVTDGGAQSVAFSPDSKRLAVGAQWVKGVVDEATPRLGIWSVPEGRLVSAGDMRKENARTREVSWSADGTRLLASQQVAASVYFTRQEDRDAGRLPFRQSKPAERSGEPNVQVMSRWLPGGGIGMGMSFGQVCFVDVEKGGVVSPWLDHGAGIADFCGMRAWRGLDSFIVTAGRDGLARIFAVTGAEPCVAIRHETALTAVRASPDGKAVLTASFDGTAQWWRVSTAALQPEWIAEPEAADYHAARLSPDGAHFVTACRDGMVRVRDAATGREVSVMKTLPLTKLLWWLFREPFRIRGVDFDASGEHVVTTDSLNIVHVWRWRTQEQVAMFSPSVFIPLRSVRFHPRQSNFLAVCGDDGFVAVCDWTTTKRLTLLPHPCRVDALAWSPDGTRLATGAEDGRVRIWEWPAGKESAPGFRHDAAVLSVEWHPDGHSLLSGSKDSTAVVWAADTGRRVIRPLRHGHNVWSAAFSRDGRHLVTGSEDKTARVWDAESGHPLTEPLPHGGFVKGVLFDAAGRFLYTVSADPFDNYCRRWPVPDASGQPAAHWIRLAEEQAGWAAGE